jgi:hypothetical protein
MGQVFEVCLHDNCDVSLSGNWLRRAAKVYVTCHTKKDLGLSGDVSLFLLAGLGCAAKYYVVKTLWIWIQILSWMRRLDCNRNDQANYVSNS